MHTSGAYPRSMHAESSGAQLHAANPSESLISQVICADDHRGACALAGGVTADARNVPIPLLRREVTPPAEGKVRDHTVSFIGPVEGAARQVRRSAAVAVSPVQAWSGRQAALHCLPREHTTEYEKPVCRSKSRSESIAQAWRQFAAGNSQTHSHHLQSLAVVQQNPTESSLLASCKLPTL